MLYYTIVVSGGAMCGTPSFWNTSRAFTTRSLDSLGSLARLLRGADYAEPQTLQVGSRAKFNEPLSLNSLGYELSMEP